jgi:hypothetical protein
MADLRARGIVTKVRSLKTGQTAGGIPFTRGPLAYLLRNRFYVGEIVFKGETLTGEQPAIVDRELFDAVQAKPQQRPNRPRQFSRSPFPGNGISGPEKNAQKRPADCNDAVSENEPSHRSPPIRGLSYTFRKSPVAHDCVVADAVEIEPVSTADYPDIRKSTGYLCLFAGNWAANRVRNAQSIGTTSAIPYERKQRIFLHGSG